MRISCRGGNGDFIIGAGIDASSLGGLDISLEVLSKFEEVIPSRDARLNKFLDAVCLTIVG